ncbi:MAG: Verru_Chthon cassette protein B [Verrucomicrobiales bacterium]|jgi:uncharacterized protein (TIGR02598 family)|nr:Verru_Chthon cassette protein B [Verrucomicrobiales bacterium]
MNRTVNKHAFSLVEVVLAIGVMAFGLMVIIGLLPIGMKSNRDSTEENQAVSIMQAVIADRQGTDYDKESAIYGVPALSGTSDSAQWSSGDSGTCYVLVSGSVVQVNDSVTSEVVADSRYMVIYTLYSGTNLIVSGNTSPINAIMNIRVSWPAQQTQSSSAVETTAVFTSP